MSILVVSLIFIFITWLLTVAVQRRLYLRRVRNKINLRIEAMYDSGGQSTLLQKPSVFDQISSTASSNFLWLYLSTLGVQSGLHWNKKRLIVTFAGLWIASYVAFRLVIDSLAAQLVLGFIFSGVVFYVYVSDCRARRIRSFVLSLPDALGVIVRSLRAGHPFAEGIRMVAEEMPDPIGGEFRYMMNQLAIGAAPADAMLKMYRSVGANDLKLMTITLSVQSGTGGNLAEVFKQLAATVRERTIFEVRVKALSAEARSSAAIMSLFPLILFGILNLAAPGYFDPVWASEYSVHIVSAGLGAIALGSFILMRMANFDS